MKEIKLKECPCCGGESKFRSIDGVRGRPMSVYVHCTKCGLETKAFKVSVDYCAKEEAAKVWNERYTETNRCDFVGITVDELERALKKMEQEFNAKKIMEEEKYRETPKCPICGHRGYNIREIGSDSFNTYVIMTCRNCDTEIRTDKEKIDKFFLERLVQDIEK
ncbi:MAG: Lar family restriction alleviation protein [Clostridium sp.]|nr:Lar family restriction alleviation protein [Clostridium sp.]